MNLSFPSALNACLQQWEYITSASNLSAGVCLLERQNTFDRSWELCFCLNIDMCTHKAFIVGCFHYRERYFKKLSTVDIMLIICRAIQKPHIQDIFIMKTTRIVIRLARVCVFCVNSCSRGAVVLQWLACLPVGPMIMYSQSHRCRRLLNFDLGWQVAPS